PGPEALEKRALLSTILVSSSADSGNGSLRQAIADASAGDTIDFSSSLSGSTIGLTSGSLVINKDLTITGPGLTNLSVSGAGLTSPAPIFAIDVGVTATISGLTVKGGKATHGAGVLDSGKLTLKAVALTGNTAQGHGGNGQGGGIY